MAHSAPSTPEKTLGRKPARRSSTMRATSTSSSGAGATAEIGAAEGKELLYEHPHARIVKFAPPGARSRPHGDTGPPGTLPWSVLNERPMSLGTLQIYRVPGMTVYLHSGDVHHAIMLRSQCWCVDGVSKFALPASDGYYFRIELPAKTPDEKDKVEQMKDTLKKVLRFETTACPFDRSFTVELPEEPKVIKKTKRRSHGPAKKWKLERQFSWKPEDGEEPQRMSDDSSESSGTSSDDGSTTDTSEPAGAVSEPEVDAPSRPSDLAGLRSVTAPSQLSTGPTTTSPSRIQKSINMDGAADARAPVAAPARLDASRLRTFQPILTDMPPSPPDSSAGLDLAETPSRGERVGQEARIARTRAQGTDVLGAVDADSDDKTNPRFAEERSFAAEQSVTKEQSFAEEPCVTEEQSVVEEPGVADERGVAKEQSFAEDQSVAEEPSVAEDPSVEEERGFAEERGVAEEQSVIEEPSVAEEQGIAEEQSVEKEQGVAEEQSVAEVPSVGEEPGVAEEQSVAEDGQGDDLQKRTTNAAHDLPATDDLQPTYEPEPAPSIDRPQTPTHQVLSGPEDPYSAIRSSIDARRSIGRTAAFYPSKMFPAPGYSSSSSSITSTTTPSRRPSPTQHQQAFTSAAMQKACTAVIGPAARLTAIMLGFAVRAANGTFGNTLLVHSPAGSKHVPGSFNRENIEGDGSNAGAPDDVDEEDDFGVPLRSPVRRAGRAETSAPMPARGGGDSDLD